jgi:signal transduction histidine kinase/ActR/RegA family two-component response regulator
MKHPSTETSEASNSSKKLRARAEKLLGRNPDNIYDLDKIQVKELVEELRIHQIQLEMQNEDLRRSHSELEKARKQYFDLYNNAPVGYLISDGFGNISSVNQKLAEMLKTTKIKLLRHGFTPFLGQKDSDFFYLHCRKVIQLKNGYTSEIELTLPENRNAFLKFDSVLLNRSLPDDQKSIRTTINDLTEQKRLQIQISQNQKMEALGTLSGGIAHDFNNLLVPIMGYAEMIKVGLEPNCKEFGYAAAIGESARIAKDLIEKILLFSRKSPTITQSVQIKSVLEECLTLIRASIPKNIDIRQEIDFTLPLISADPSQLHQVIINLCTNAAQAMPEGGDLWIRLNHIKHTTFSKTQEPPAQENDLICLSVQDDGCGMDVETLKRIYEPFFSTKVKGEQRGTGLGLAIVSNIVKQRNWHLEVESKVGAGTIFRIYFPALPKDIALTPKATDTPFVAGAERTLLVDDDRLVNKLGTTFLEKLGFKVTSFLDSQEALNEFERNAQDYQLVITDYSMAQLSGPQLIQKIRHIRSDIPILLITGYTNLATPETLQEWGCDGIITKPYNLKQLSNSIQRVLSRTKL